MGARYPYYLLADSPEGQRKEAEVTRTPPKSSATHSDIRLGFVYERVPHITLKRIANNAEIDVIWDKWQATLDPSRTALNTALGKQWQEWEIPREADPKWPAAANDLHDKLVGGAHRATEGDRRLDRRQGRVRISLRQALCRQFAHPCRRPVHRREPVAAPRRSRSIGTMS